MTSEPFDEELEKDIIVPADFIPNRADTPMPVVTVEDFKRQLAKLSPDELAFLLNQMMTDDSAGHPGNSRLGMQE
jgi:hypothetical protein